jgi:hypothetical protein
MEAPSIGGERCAWCGSPAHDKHHAVPRSRGGTNGPTIRLCGFGNASGCHGKAHAARLHFDYAEGRWLGIEVAQPTKRDRLPIHGWRPLQNQEVA